MTANKTVITADEIAECLGVSKSSAYKIMHTLNKELKAKGFYTVAGKLSRRYFEEKFYGLKSAEEGWELRIRTANRSLKPI